MGNRWEHLALNRQVHAKTPLDKGGANALEILQSCTKPSIQTLITLDMLTIFFLSIYRNEFAFHFFYITMKCDISKSFLMEDKDLPMLLFNAIIAAGLTVLNIRASAAIIFTYNISGSPHGNFELHSTFHTLLQVIFQTRKNKRL